MIIRFNLLRLSIISLLVILFPLIQNQWLNLYLFDKDNFTIYKLLYFLSGLIFPILVCITSLKYFTYYKFDKNKITNNRHISGKSFPIITVLSLITLSTLISGYIFINFKIFQNFLTSIIFVVIISFLLLFKKIKLFIKKIILINFFIISFIIWYSKINNILFNEIFLINNFLKFENINSINIFFLLFIELAYYLWSYISNGSYLSDWNIPWLYKSDILPFLNILFFYLMIIIYYSILYD